MRAPCVTVLGLTVPGLIVLATVAGCASQPSRDPVPKEAVAMASAAEPAAAAAAVDGVFRPPAGYKKHVENGQTIYCMKIVVLGSRFPKEDCRTQGELEDLEMQKASMRNDMKQKQSVCGAAAACGSN